MSSAQTARVPKLRLLSLDEVKERVGITQLEGYTEHITCKERVVALGATIKKHLQQVDAKLEKLDSVKNSLSLKSLDTLRKTISLHEALNEQSSSLLKCVVDHQLQGENSVKSLHLIRSAQQFLEKGMVESLVAIQPRLEQALDALAKSTQTAHLELARIEQDVLISKTTESLSALGYSVKKKSTKNGLLVRALKNDVSIAAQITPDGDLHIDMAGFEGGVCKQELDKLNRELTNRGVGFEVAYTRYHGKKSGGVLAQEAEKELPADFNPLAQGTEKKKQQKGNRLPLLHLQRRKQRVR